MMTKSRSLLTLALLAAVSLSLTSCGPYNRLVALDEGVDTAWSQVENVYQRRADLVPNLVETVKGAAAFEQDTFTAVAEARSKVNQIDIEGVPDAAQMQQFQAAQEELSSALSRLLVTVERYPELSATQAFRDLQAQLEGTENRIAVERKRFNEAVREYNTARRQVPTNLYAMAFGFDEKTYFAASPGSDEAPKVEF